MATMERVSVLCEDKKIVEERVSPESVNVPERPQPCPADLHALLREMSAKLADHELRIQQLQTVNQVAQVAFSASLLASGSATLGPFNTDTNLVFRYVFSNIGNAYNPHTGFFTAPVRGAYHFEYYIGAGGGSHASAVGLQKNGEHIVSAWEHQTSGQSKAANGVTLVMEAGDVVGLCLGSGLIIFDNPHHHSTFSGHMLFPM